MIVSPTSKAVKINKKQEEEEGTQSNPMKNQRPQSIQKLKKYQVEEHFNTNQVSLQQKLNQKKQSDINYNEQKHNLAKKRNKHGDQVNPTRQSNLKLVKRNTVDEILHGFDDQTSSQGSLDSSNRDILQKKIKNFTQNPKSSFDIDIKNNKSKIEDIGFEKTKKQELHNKPTWKYQNDIDGKILTDSQSQNEPTILEIVIKCNEKICADPFNSEDVKINDSYTYFDKLIFAKIFLYHIIFFAALGPFSYPLLRIFESRAMLKNLGFYGFSLILLNQVAHWLLFTIPLIIYCVRDEIREDLSYTYLIVASLALILRCLIISVRYATSLESTIQAQKQSVLTRKQILDEQIISAWMNISPKNIEQEIKHCMIRNEVENIFFKFKFSYHINEEYKNRFTNYEFVNTWDYNQEFEINRFNQFIKFFKQTQQKLQLRSSLGKSSIHINPKNNEAPMEIEIAYLITPTKEDLVTSFSGRLVFRELFLMSKHLAPYKLSKIMIFLSFVHAILPLTVEIYQNYDSYAQKEARFTQAYYWFYTTPLLIFTFTFYNANFIFLQMAIIDLHRRKLNMILCETFLEPNRFKVKDKFQAIPLINFYDPKTLQSWLDLRIMAQDMGIRFKLRLDSYVYFFMVAYGLIGSLWLGWFFELFTEYDIEFSFILTIGFELAMVCLIIYKVFYYGAWVNEISNNQILRIVELRNVLERFKSEWKDAQYYGSLEDKLINNTFKEAYRYFTYKKKEFGLKSCIFTLNRSLEVLNAIEKRLQREIQFNPIALFGIPLTVTILNALKTSFVTLIFAMINFKFQFIS
eukprot:403362459